MVSSVRGIVAIAALVAAACDSTDQSAEQTTALSAVSTTETTDRTGRSTTPVPEAVVATTTSTTTAVEASTTVRAPEPVVLDDPESLASIGFFGDSIIADLTAIGGRNNQVVPQLVELLIGDDQLNVRQVENFALPGQSIVTDTGILEPEQSTLDSYVEQRLRENPDLVDLAVVAISSTDINLNASLPEPATTAELADRMIAVLVDVEASFDAAGIEVVFVPIFGINDPIFQELRCAFDSSCPVAPDREIESINTMLWNSGVSMLFERFEELDSDGDGRADRHWFDNVDPRYPDDGVHPNADGQMLYAQTVYQSLRQVLTRT